MIAAVCSSMVGLLLRVVSLADFYDMNINNSLARCKYMRVYACEIFETHEKVAVPGVAEYSAATSDLEYPQQLDLV